jgi:hypothetical protein
MVVYTCERCLKQFGLKIDYERHIKRKIPCTNNSIIANEYNELKLEHLRILEENKQLKERLNEKDEMIKTLLSKQRCRGKQITNDNSTSNNQCTTNNNTLHLNNIEMSGFGFEQWRDLNDNEIRAVLMAPNTVLAIIKQIHLNPRLQFYHNICVSNNRSNKCYIVRGKKWELMSTERMISDMMNVRMSDLQDMVEYMDTPNNPRVREVTDQYWNIDMDGFVAKNTAPIKEMLYNCTRDNKAKYKTFIERTPT